MSSSAALLPAGWLRSSVSLPRMGSSRGSCSQTTTVPDRTMRIYMFVPAFDAVLHSVLSSPPPPPPPYAVLSHWMSFLHKALGHHRRRLHHPRAPHTTATTWMATRGCCCCWCGCCSCSHCARVALVSHVRVCTRRSDATTAACCYCCCCCCLRRACCCWWCGSHAAGPVAQRNQQQQQQLDVGCRTRHRTP